MSQKRLNGLIVDAVIEKGVALSVVEQLCYKALAGEKRARSHLHVMSRQSLSWTINQEFDSMVDVSTRHRIGMKIFGAD